MIGRVESKRLLLVIALLLAICLKWYITDIYLFSICSVTLVFCILMQFSNRYVSLLHSKSVVYEDLTDESKTLYLLFIRFGMAVAIVVVIDYTLINYKKQSLYNTLGIIGGLYTIMKRVEGKLAKLFLVFVYYVIHKQKPYEKHQSDDREDSARTVLGQ